MQRNIIARRLLDLGAERVMDAAERALLAATVARRDSPARRISRPRSTPRSRDLGWLEMLDAEPRDAIDIVFTALGRDERAGHRARRRRRGARSGIDAAPDLAVLLPPFGAWHPPGRIDGERVRRRSGSRRPASRPPASSSWCRRAGTGRRRGHRARRRRRDPPGAGHRSRRRLPHRARRARRGRRRRRFDVDAWDAARRARSARPSRTRSRARAATMLDLARTHALERVQFGRPIASFQAVRHRLADALVAIEALDATLGAAGDEPEPD